jgi:hypothetical protein
MTELPLIILVLWLVLVVAKSSVMESVLLYNCCCGYVKLQNLFQYLALSSNRTHKLHLVHLRILNHGFLSIPSVPHLILQHRTS